eukprot:CAMPEP_0183370862 /NCGR_PEP_ID=MMETSP0164_2-20130417/103693_1 /TAXON_ID=221442 /ORGANISM="Coccolithus pelagicus ssp braarudi, Strain PLY182g" /LENGTH=40 /DNA_ID= /DNA_START= /DNA_END= /DNA_ORIENTATION=
MWTVVRHHAAEQLKVAASDSWAYTGSNVQADGVKPPGQQC